MALMVLLSQLLLAVTFFLSGLGKLLDRQATEQAALSMGIPRRLSPGTATLLPIVELLLVPLLLIPQTAEVASGIALALLLAFTALVLNSLARGKTVSCNCFGVLSSGKALGWTSVLRNAVLGSAAAVAFLGGRTVAPSYLWDRLPTDGSTRLIIFAICLVFMVAAASLYLSFLLVKQNGRLMLRLAVLESPVNDGVDPGPTDASVFTQGLPVGSLAPSFELRGLRGETLTLESQLSVGLPALLVFVSPNCGPCHQILPELAKWQRTLRNDMTTLIIAEASQDEASRLSETHQISTLLLQQDQLVSQSYQARGTPSGVLINPDGRVASPVAAGAKAIRELVDSRNLWKSSETPLPSSTVGHSHAPEIDKEKRIVFGSRLPSTQLLDFDGLSARLPLELNSHNALLFWNPSCGFCTRMLPELKGWEASREAHAPTLFLVSSGDAERSRETGLEASLFLDKDFRLGSAVGATGTPSAILVNSNADIISNIAVGAEAVFELLQRNSIPESSELSLSSKPKSHF